MSQVKKLRARLKVTLCLQRVVEILAGDLVQMVRDPVAQRVGHIDLLAGNRDLHAPP